MSTKITVGSVVQQMNACAQLEGLDLSWVGGLKTSQVAKGQQHQELQLPVLVPDSHSVGKAPNLHFLPVLVGSERPALLTGCCDLNMFLHPQLMLKGFGRKALT